MNIIQNCAINRENCILLFSFGPVERFLVAKVRVQRFNQLESSSSLVQCSGTSELKKLLSARLPLSVLMLPISYT